MRVAVMGTGGVGGYFGALLARAGHEVTFVARGAHLAAMQERGLRIDSTLDGTFTVQGRAVEETTEVGSQDLVLFTVKMYHNAPAIEATRPLMGDETIVLTLQNGIDNGEQLAAAFGTPRVMIGSAYMEGRITAPGVIMQAGPGMAAFGEMTPGITPRGQRLLHVFREAGWRVELQENMPGVLWRKFVYIAGSAAVCAATNCDYQEMRPDQECCAASWIPLAGEILYPPRPSFPRPSLQAPLRGYPTPSCGACPAPAKTIPSRQCRTRPCCEMLRRGAVAHWWHRQRRGQSMAAGGGR